MAFLRYKFSNNKNPKFPNKFQASTRIFLVGTWTHQYKVRSSQFYITKCPAAVFPNAVKKFPNQVLRNIPRTDFNTKFTIYNAE